jgi:hypothetical protein
MLTIAEPRSSIASPLSRRTFLRAGALGMGGLSLVDLLALRARATPAPAVPAKSVIMIYLPGGPSHIDMYDMKPDAPAEYRGEFEPIATNVPGLDICELMPLQATIADKFSVIRGIKWLGRHDAYELLSGRPSAQSGEIRVREKWPVMGAVVSHVRGRETSAMPPYVSLNDLRLTIESDDPEVPRYLGQSHAPFRPKGPDLANLRLPTGVSADRFDDRRSLLSGLNQARRQLDRIDKAGAVDTFQRQALEMVTSGATYQALDLTHEDPRVLEHYKGCKSMLMARRLVEAGVSMVTVALGGLEREPGGFVGGVWDTHANNFQSMRKLLPEYDRAVHALVTDLYQRGLDKQVAVVIWGEFGRTPKIGAEAAALGDKYARGRGHWWDNGFALLIGGGLGMGQVVGQTDARAERNKGRPYTPQNVLATLYRHLGIDPATTFLDYQGRPIHLLEDWATIAELV